MNEVELVDALTNSANGVMTFFLAYLSATSAFLAVAFMAAAQIPKRLSQLVVAIYSLASIFIAVSFQRTGAFTEAIREQMRESGMDWHPAVSEPSWFLPGAVWLGAVTMLLIFVSSLAYYFHARNEHE